MSGQGQQQPNPQYGQDEHPGRRAKDRADELRRKVKETNQQSELALLVRNGR